MAKIEGVVEVAGSHFEPLAGANCVGEEDGAKLIRVTVAVRRSQPLRDVSDDPEWPEMLPHQRPPVDLARYGSDPRDIARVEAFAHDQGLRVVESTARGCRVVLEASAATLASAFRTRLVRYEHPRGDHRGHTGAIHLPEGLSDIVTGVFGLHDQPLADVTPAFVAAPGAGRTALSPAELAERYNFPQATGRGQRIGIIELGGGFRHGDLEAFFAPGPVPKITEVLVGEGRNAPAPVEDVGAMVRFIRDIADGKAPESEPSESAQNTLEVTMDVELVGAFAPEAEIIVYFAENHNYGLVEALQLALDPDGLRPTVLSLSWSWKEAGGALEDHVNDRLREAAHAGITFCVASGDFGARGSRDAPENSFHPRFPPTSPYALACGGTTLEISNDEVHAEVVWSTGSVGMASGGGVSEQLALPRWQVKHDVPASHNGFAGRGFPDVAADADPTAHCEIFAGGEWGPAAGTSAAAPLWAALIARLNESLEAPVGYLNPLLYRFAQDELRATWDIVEGDNGPYRARAGWDACTGLGSPRGKRLLAALRGD